MAFELFYLFVTLLLCLSTTQSHAQEPVLQYRDLYLCFCTNYTSLEKAFEIYCPSLLFSPPPDYWSMANVSSQAWINTSPCWLTNAQPSSVHVYFQATALLNWHTILCMQISLHCSHFLPKDHLTRAHNICSWGCKLPVAASEDIWVGVWVGNARARHYINLRALKSSRSFLLESFPLI